MNKAKSILKFILITLIYFVITGVVLLSVGAKDEGTIGDNLFFNFCADYLFVIAIPALLFINLLANTNLVNTEYVSLSLLFTAIIYTVITYIVFKFVKAHRRKKNNEQRTPTGLPSE
jgi:hypothetical protein